MEVNRRTEGRDQSVEVIPVGWICSQSIYELIEPQTG